MKRALPLAMACCLVTLPAHAQLGADLPGSLPGLEKAPPFTADVIITSRALPRPTAYHITYMPQRIRIETGGEDGQTIITRLDQGTVYMSQGGNQWMQMPLSAVGGLGSFDHAVRKTGQAMIDGKTCDVYQSQSADGTTTSTNYLYRNAPLRSIVQSPTGTTHVDYRNLRIGQVSSSLFDLPANAEVMSMESILNQGLKPQNGELGN